MLYGSPAYLRMLILPILTGILGAVINETDHWYYQLTTFLMILSSTLRVGYAYLNLMAWNVYIGFKGYQTVDKILYMYKITP